MQYTLLILISFVFFTACAKSDGIIDPAHRENQTFPTPATSPELLMENLRYAFKNRDAATVEDLLDSAFVFSEIDSNGAETTTFNLEQELGFIRGGGTEQRPGIFSIFHQVEYDFALIRRWEETVEQPTEEKWDVFRGRVRILLLDASNDGFRVDQVMVFKLRQTSVGKWKIIRWISESIEGPTQGTWGGIKRLFWENF